MCFSFIIIDRYEQLARAMAGRMECSEQEARHAARDVLMALINVSARVNICRFHLSSALRLLPMSLPGSTFIVSSALKSV